MSITCFLFSGIDESYELPVIQNGSLVFTVLRAEDEGEYECLAQNNAGQPLRKVVTLSVTGELSVEVIPSNKSQMIVPNLLE